MDVKGWIAGAALALACVGGAEGQIIAKARVGVTPSFDAAPVLAAIGVERIESALPFQPANRELAERIGLDRYYRLTLRDGLNAEVAAAAIRRVTDLFEAVETEHLGTRAGEFPEDPYFACQWNLRNTGGKPVCIPSGATAPHKVWLTGHDIDAAGGWMVRSGAPGVRIAVIDSGVSPHEDLAEMTLGWAHDGGSWADQCNHGTHVAGTMGALAGNGKGIAGVVWGSQIVPVRVLSGCWGTDAQYAAGVIWAADHADVANSSLQYYTVGQIFEDALDYAQAQGLVMVAASGNWASMVAWPARHPGVIAVGATTNKDALASFSNSGPEVEISAPGEDVLSLDRYGGYKCNSGTSMASPHVAAAAALILAEAPGAGLAEVRQILSASVRDLGPAGFDPEFGWGRLDLRRAMRLARCYADADCSGSLNAADVSVFRTMMEEGRPYADVDLNGVIDQADFAAYMDRFAAGCWAHQATKAHR